MGHKSDSRRICDHRRTQGGFGKTIRQGLPKSDKFWSQKKKGGGEGYLRATTSGADLKRKRKRRSLPKRDKFWCMRLRKEDVRRVAAMAVVGMGEIWRAVALDG